MLSPAVQASVDQLAALARDAYLEFGVDINDPIQVRAIEATWYMVAANQHAVPWILNGIAQAIQPA